MIPIHDWQFWVATVLAIGALVVVVRPLLPSKRKGASCPSCPSANPKTPSTEHIATLTIDGKSIKR